MAPSTHTIIAQLLYLDAPPLNFARLVSDLDKVVARLQDLDYTLTWDCDDVAIFQSGYLRLLLAITDAPGTDYAACLTVTAGPAMPDAVPSPLLRRADQLCRLITAQLDNTTHPDATLWHCTRQIATADLVDSMVWSLADVDLIAWAEPIDLTEPAPQRQAAGAGLPRNAVAPQVWQMLAPGARGVRPRITAARNLSLTSAVIAYGNPLLMPFI